MVDRRPMQGFTTSISAWKGPARCGRTRGCDRTALLAVSKSHRKRGENGCFRGFRSSQVEGPDPIGHISGSHTRHYRVLFVAKYLIALRVAGKTELADAPADNNGTTIKPFRPRF
jgi:hypothetical protein